MKYSLVAVFLTIASFSFGQDESNKYDAHQEMREEMRIIVNELGLQASEIVEVGKIMEARRDRKAVIQKEIESLESQMKALDEQSEEQIKTKLSPEQQANFEEIVKPKLEARKSSQEE